MKKLVRNLCITTVVLSLLLSMAVFSASAAGQPSTYSNSSNSGQRDVVCTTLSGTDAGTYYTGSNTFANLSGKSSTELLTALRSLMTSTHKKISTYDNCRDKADKTDCQNNDNSVVLLYTSYVSSMSQYNGWNREHVWPKSLGGGNTNGGGADLHHIRPSDASVNSSRGNKKYGNVTNGTLKYGSNPATGVLGGEYNGTYFEPLDNVKGDVARICLYVYVRWGSSWGADSITEVFQSVDVLLEWMEIDPVDTWEMGRNEVVAEIQGNRNVFIDYPELAWKLFGKSVPKSMKTPSGNAANMGGNNAPTTTKKPVTTKAPQNVTTQKPVTSKAPQNVTTKAPQNVTTRKPAPTMAPNSGCQHKNMQLQNVVEVSCTVDGYTGDAYCPDCKNTVKGERIPASGHKNQNGDMQCDVCGFVFGGGNVNTTTADETITTPTTVDGAADEVGGNGSEKSDKTIVWIIIAVGVGAVVAVAVVLVIRSKKEREIETIVE